MTRAAWSVQAVWRDECEVPAEIAMAPHNNRMQRARTGHKLVLYPRHRHVVDAGRYAQDESPAARLIASRFL